MKMLLWNIFCLIYLPSRFLRFGVCFPLSLAISANRFVHRYFSPKLISYVGQLAIYCRVCFSLKNDQGKLYFSIANWKVKNTNFTNKPIFCLNIILVIEKCQDVTLDSCILVVTNSYNFDFPSFPFSLLFFKGALKFMKWQHFS